MVNLVKSVIKGQSFVTLFAINLVFLYFIINFNNWSYYIYNFILALWKKNMHG